VIPTLIFCAGGSPRMMQIAIDAGFRCGAQLPDTVYFPLYFADQDWRKPNRGAYMAALAQHRPEMATVLDWERGEQLPEVLDWAEEAAQFVKRVLIIPKVIGGITQLPRRINGADVVLAYSVPSKYGGSEVPLWEFAGWPVHLLGGSPHRQMMIWMHLTPICDVVTADGNMASKMALRCVLWHSVPGPKGHWRTLSDLGLGGLGNDAKYEAFRYSCENIAAAWRKLGGCD